MSADQLKDTRELRITLSNPSKGNLKLYFQPKEWKDAGFSLKRSETYSGVTRKYALDKLSFPKEGKKYIEDVEEDQGFEAEIGIKVEKWSGAEPIGYFLEFEGVLKLVDKDVDDTIYSVSVIDSSFEDKVLNRDSVPVIMTKKTPDEILKSLDGAEIVGYSNEGTLTTLPSRFDFLNTSFVANRSEYYESEGDPMVIVVDKTSSDYDDDSSVKSNVNEYASVNGAFFINSEAIPSNISANGSFSMRLSLKNIETLEEGDIADVSINLYTFSVDDNSLLNKINIPFSFIKVVIRSSTVYDISGSFNFDALVESDSYIQFGVENAEAITTGTIFDFSFRSQGGFSPQVNFDGWLPHEAYSRIITKYTGVSVPVYSDYFGRKDSEPRSYTYDGKGALRTTTNGALIRGFPQTSSIGLDDQIAPLSMSLKDKFTSDNSIDPIGLGIELIDGQKTIRIEEIGYFFDTRVALLIDNATEVKKEYNKDLIYNEISIGNSKVFADEIIDGVYDYNNKSDFANATTSVQSKKSTISNYSFSNASINEARNKTRDEEPTTDSKYDDVNYVIDVVENVTGNAVSNPNADSGLADWNVSGGVSVQDLIGSNRFVLDQNDETKEEMWQNLSAIPEPVASFSYAVISEDELLVTPTVSIIARLNDDTYKSLDQNGEWVDDQLSFPITSIQGVKAANFQSMNKFQIAANEILDDVNYIWIAFNTEFLSDKTGVNKLIIDDIYVSDSAKYKARTTEGFDSISGIVNSDESYNIDFAPARCLRRRGRLDRAQLESKLNTSLVFTDSEKNSTLVSKKTDEDFEVAESTDILVNDLDEPLWTIEKITFDAKLTTTQKQELNDVFSDGKPKYLGLIGYKRSENDASYSYGWLDDYSSGGVNDKATFEIRPVSKYITVAEEAVFVDDDNVEFTDNDNIEFIGD